LRTLLSWLLTPVHLLAFGGTLVVFHVAQVVARPMGYAAHKRVGDLLNGTLLASLRLLGAGIEVKIVEDLPAQGPLIVVSNHQSMYDVPLLGWTLRRHHPKFVAKVELGRWIPSVSYNLRHGGSVLIDRAQGRRALSVLKSFGEQVEERAWAACIFPEGTRSRTGEMGAFQAPGLAFLLRGAPTAAVIPVAIEGSWRLLAQRMLPMPWGVPLRCTVLPPIAREGRTEREVMRDAESAIRRHLEGEAARGAGVGAEPAPGLATPS